MHVLNKGSLVLLTVLIVTFAHESQIKWTLLFAAALVLEFMGGLFAQARRTHSFFHRSFDRCALNFPIALICFWAGFDSTECYFKPVWHSQVVAITAGCLSTVTSGLAALDIDYFANSGVARDIDTSAVYTLIHFLLRTTEVATRVITLTVLCIVLRLLISESGLESALPNMLTSLLVCCPIIFLWGLNVSILRWSSNISGMPKDAMLACSIIGWVALGSNPVLFLLDVTWYSISARRANIAITAIRCFELAGIALLVYFSWDVQITCSNLEASVGIWFLQEKLQYVLLGVYVAHMFLYVGMPRLLTRLACRRVGTNAIPFLPSTTSRWAVQDVPTSAMATYLVNSGDGVISKLVPMEAVNTHIYKVEACLGQGSYGVVVRVRKEERNEEPTFFALKLQYSGGKGNRRSSGPMRSPHEMAMRERDVYRKIWEEVDETTGRLGHPFIVKLVCYSDWPEEKRLVYEGSDSPVQFFLRDPRNRVNVVTKFDSALLMEYCASGSLEDYVPANMRRGVTDKETSGGIQWTELARRFFAEILLALDFLQNTKSVIYRDLKLDNVFVVHDSSRNAHVKLGDFGFSKVVSDMDKPTSIAGSPYFAAPEIMAMHSNQKSSLTDWSLDVFSLGVVMFVVLYGAEFDKRKNAWVMAHHRKPPDAMHPVHAQAGFEAALRDLERRVPASALDMVRQATKSNADHRTNVAQMMLSPFFEELQWPNGARTTPILWSELELLNL